MLTLEAFSFQFPASSGFQVFLEAGNWELHAKRRPAPARAFGVGVVEQEPLADQAGVVVERRAVDESVALLVHENARALRTLEDVVAFPGCRLPREGIAQPRAAAGFDADAQP